MKLSEPDGVHSNGVIPFDSYDDNNRVLNLIPKSSSSQSNSNSHQIHTSSNKISPLAPYGHLTGAVPTPLVGLISKSTASNTNISFRVNSVNNNDNNSEKNASNTSNIQNDNDTGRLSTCQN